MRVEDWLTVDGTISANGGSWLSKSAGGGSGGGVAIHAATIEGAGLIEASGGDGYTTNGGGGGGGRVAIYYMISQYVGECIN